MSDTILVVDPSFRGPQGAAGTAANNLAVSSMADLKALPKPLTNTTPCVLGGWYLNGDGGGGQFIWDANSVLTPNDGTIVQANAGGIGRWLRLLEDSKISVKWFGAKGDAIQDDSALIQKAIDFAYATRQALGSPGDPIVKGTTVQTAYEVYFPKGKYLVNTTIEVPAYISLIGEHTAMLYTANVALPLVRTAGYFNFFKDIGFGGGKHHIVFYGNSVNYGVIGDPNNPAIIGLYNCVFRYPNGPALYSDTTVNADRSTSQLIVDGFDFQGASFLFGTFRSAKFINGYAVLDHTTIAVNDDAGRRLSVWNCSDDLTIENTHCVPNASIIGANSSTWICGTTNLTARNVRFNSDDSAVIMRVRANLVYNGMALPVSSSGLPRIVLDQCHPNSCFGLHWLEIYDVFPSMIDVQMPYPDLYDATARPDKMFPSCVGIWVNSTTCPKSSYISKNGTSCYIDFHGLEKTNYEQVRIKTSAAPTDTVMEDVTGQVLTYMPRAMSKSESGPALRRNVWISGAWNLTDGAAAVNISGLVSVIVNDTGYTMTKWTSAIATDGASLNITYPWGAGISAGLYTISLLVKANYTGKCTFDLVDTEHLHDMEFYESDEYQRISVPFYHDGVAKTVALTFDLVPAGKEFTAGLIQVNKGITAAPLTVAGNATTNSIVHSQYWGNAAPAVGNYRIGDIVWNSAPTATSNMLWYCYADGSPGSWASAAGATVTFANDLSGTPTSQNVLSATGVAGFFNIKCNFINYSAGLTTPRIFQDPAPVNDGRDMFIFAQGTLGIDKDGGKLRLSGGAHTGVGQRGGVQIQMDEGLSTMVELAQLDAKRFVSLCRINTVTLAQMPFDTGDAVLYLANCVDTPKANCTDGIIIYCTGGTLKTRGSAGTITNLAPP